MREKITEGTFGSTEVFDQLEGYARGEIQHWMQKLLEEEVTSVLGRIKGGRKASVDRASGYRNGFGKGRRFSMSSGTIDVRRPRVRGLEARFERRVLPLFRRRTKEVGELLPQLYLHGLSQGDFELALRGLLGDGAPLSGSSIERLRGAWQKRSLKGIEPVYLWADGGYVKAGLEQEKAALLVVIAGLRDGRTVVLAVEPPAEPEISRDPDAEAGRSNRSGARITRSSTCSTAYRSSSRPKPERCSARCPTPRRGKRPRSNATVSSSASATPIPTRPKFCAPTGSAWSPSMAFRKSTGSTCARPILSSHPSRPGAGEQRRRSA